MTQDKVREEGFKGWCDSVATEGSVQSKNIAPRNAVQLYYWFVLLKIGGGVNVS